MATSIRAAIDPDFTFIEYPIDVVEQFCVDLEKIFDPLTGNLLQGLNIDQEHFIRHEISRSKVDFNPGVWCL